MRESSLVAGCLFLALLPNLAQIGPAQDTVRKVPAQTPAAALSLLIEKGHALEARGRPDLAIQVWQQVLLADPKNVVSLVGMARDLKLTGSDQAIDALDKLRKASPNNPDIPLIEGMPSTHAETGWLRQAADLARQGKNDDAMRIYRQLYGDHPPDGDIALAYYQTLYGTASGKPQATAAMRGLAQRNSGDPRFSVELGVMLSYAPVTRSEGIRLLKVYSKDATAQAALRQALVWDAANLSSVPEMRDYLKNHPEDAELAARLKENEAKLMQENTGIGRSPVERAAFAALDARHLDDAEKRFTAILEEEPANGRAAAGMGFLRVLQKNYAEATSYFTRAEENGFKDRIVEDALASARFGSLMGEAVQALSANQLDAAVAKFRAALELRPHSIEALNGLAGLLARQQQYAQAALLYDQLTRVQPDSTDGWRGLFLAYASDSKNVQALAVEDRIPSSVKVALARDPDYLCRLAAIYQAEGRSTDAQRVLAEALALPFPNNGSTLKNDARLEYADILMQARRFDQAVTLYTQVLGDDAANLSAWRGLLSAHHEMGQVAQAIADVEKMTPAVHEAALADPAFLILLGSIDQQAGQLEAAQRLLERAAKMLITTGGQPSVELQVQLAGLYFARNDSAHAFATYQQVLKNNPDCADAWKGLIAALEATNRNAEALQQLSLISTAARSQLDADIEFEQTESGVYAATGNIDRAAVLIDRVQAHYAQLHTLPPAPVQIQSASLLLSAGNDRALFPALMQLGGRADLSAAQRQALQDIWANWAVRRAATAMNSGSAQRAVDILDAASLAFPGNLAVRMAAAASYVQVGRAQESMAIFKSIPADKLTAADFHAAVGAAFEASDLMQAGLWLRPALQRFPHDPALLLLAARYEQARGDNQGAADYERAARAAMPSGGTIDQLAQVLVYPDQDANSHRAITAGDLARLLDPDNQPFARVTTIQSPQSSDRYDVAAPVVVFAPAQAQSKSAPQTSPKPDAPRIFPPTAVRGQSSTAPVYKPQS